MVACVKGMFLPSGSLPVYAHSQRPTHQLYFRGISGSNLLHACFGQDLGILYVSEGDGSYLWGHRPTPLWVHQSQFHCPCTGGVDPPLAGGPRHPGEGGIDTAAGLQQGVWQQRPLHFAGQSILHWCTQLPHKVVRFTSFLCWWRQGTSIP